MIDREEVFTYAAFFVYVACQDQHKNGCIRDCGGKGNAL